MSFQLLGLAIQCCHSSSKAISSRFYTGRVNGEIKATDLIREVTTDCRRRRLPSGVTLGELLAPPKLGFVARRFGCG